MKKEIHPGIIALIVVVILGVIVAIFMMSGNPDSSKVDVQQLDPQSLRDPDPPRGRPDND